MNIKPPVVIELTSDFLPGHTFYFGAVRFTEFMELEYNISPPISENNQHEYDYFLIRGEARDDLGNSYDYGGGAYGLVESGIVTTGTLSFSPLPPQDATELFFLVEAHKEKEPYSIEFSIKL